MKEKMNLKTLEESASNTDFDQNEKDLAEKEYLEKVDALPYANFEDILPDTQSQVVRTIIISLKHGGGKAKIDVLMKAEMLGEDLQWIRDQCLQYTKKGAGKSDTRKMYRLLWKKLVISTTPAKITLGMFKGTQYDHVVGILFSDYVQQIEDQEIQEQIIKN